jgi:hypothetical protein
VHFACAILQGTPDPRCGEAHPRLIRAGAQLLSGPGIRPERLVHEALKERCGEVLWHVVRAAQRFEPKNPTWRP